MAPSCLPWDLAARPLAVEAGAASLHQPHMLQDPDIVSLFINVSIGGLTPMLSREQVPALEIGIQYNSDFRAGKSKPADAQVIAGARIRQQFEKSKAVRNPKNPKLLSNACAGGGAGVGAGSRHPRHHC